mmetsp:Transcript_82778/g.222019  ORF Transcript_82778/g.222019 Transcript_82778/m.222019 type:complete len:285 (+) Transcript_82778:41-895(+)
MNFLIRAQRLGFGVKSALAQQDIPRLSLPKGFPCAWIISGREGGRPLSRTSPVHRNLSTAKPALHDSKRTVIMNCLAVVNPIGLRVNIASAGVRFMAKKAIKTNVISQNAKTYAEPTDALEVGVEKVIYTNPSPNQFRMLTGLAGLQQFFWTWATANLFLKTPVAFLGTYWCGFGLTISAMMLGMVWFHAHRHVCRLAVLPGLMDKAVITVHTMLGGTQDLIVDFFDIVPSESDGPEAAGRYVRLSVRNHRLYFIVDKEGEILHPALLQLVAQAKTLPKKLVPK